MIQILIGVVVVALFTPLITWAVARWAEREEQAQRETLDRIMRASEPPQTPGLKSSHRRIS